MWWKLLAVGTGFPLPEKTSVPRGLIAGERFFFEASTAVWLPEHPEDHRSLNCDDGAAPSKSPGDFLVNREMAHNAGKLLEPDSTRVCIVYGWISSCNGGAGRQRFEQNAPKAASLHCKMQEQHLDGFRLPVTFPHWPRPLHFEAQSSLRGRPFLAASGSGAPMVWSLCGGGMDTSFSAGNPSVGGSGRGCRSGAVGLPEVNRGFAAIPQSRRVLKGMQREERPSGTASAREVS